MVERIDNDQQPTLEEILQRFVDQQQRGQRPDIDEFVAKYPELEPQLRRRIEKLQRINFLFDTLAQPDLSEFDPSTSAQTLVGRSVGSFEIEEVIGRGGMGVVYLARDTRLKRTVAIKGIPATLTDDPAARMRFKREAEALAALNHPSIAVIYDIVQPDNDTDYLVLEYVPGETLAEHMARGPIPWEQALSIGQQIAEAVAAAHGQGIFHRDLKPGNVKITPEGRVKVLDFGLAKSSRSQDKDIEITATEPGHVIGTPAYMSPEQARAQATDQRTDIWSFGCIMFQMLTGHLPFAGETATDTLAQIIERQPDWGLLPRNIPGGIQTLLHQCLEKEPERRLGNIMEAATAIGKTLGAPANATGVSSAARPKTMAKIITAAIIVALCAVGIWFSLTQPSLRLVVLPFKNLGPAEDGYLADGIRDKIETDLAPIDGLHVISRSSAILYKNSEKTAAQIAQELSVDYFLRSTIQPEHPADPNSKVIIIPQLVRTSDSAQLWSKTYPADMPGISQMVSDLAEQLTQEVNRTLNKEERRALASLPTDNQEAYHFYFRGNDYYKKAENRRGELRRANYENAIKMYNEAIDRDPNFALAYTQRARAQLYFFRADRSAEHLALANENVDEAFRLSPGLPEAHKARGFYYYRSYDFEPALKHFTIARRGLPNDGELLAGIAYVQRRKGDFTQAIKTFEDALELSPLDVSLMNNIAETFLVLRKYAQSERYRNRAIEFFPDHHQAYDRKAWLYLFAKGNTHEARSILQKAAEELKSKDRFNGTLAVIDACEENYQEALGLCSKPEDAENTRMATGRTLRIAKIHGYMKNETLAKKYYNQAKGILESQIAKDPNHAEYRSWLGIAYAGLGQGEKAIEQGELGVELLPVSKDAMLGVFRVEELALIYTMVGKHDKAIDKLKDLLDRPGQLSRPWLKTDPDWKPLWDLPRFKQLVGEE